MIRICAGLTAMFALGSLVQLQTGASFAMPQSKSAGAGSAKAKTQDLTGVYQLVEDSMVIPGGMKNSGSPDDVSLQPAALAKEKTADLEEDGAKNCAPIGPFRMMAWRGNKIEFLMSPGRVTMLFENIALGHMRTFYLDRPHDTKLEPLWEGDSIAHWEKDTLVVDTNNFNEYVWLNSAGAPHSAKLYVIERYRLIDEGKYLEVKVTAEDPSVLTKPYTYTRYYERTEAEVREMTCMDDVVRTLQQR